jgi:hypothetical protein
MNDFKQNHQAKLRLPEEVRRDERAARREPDAAVEAKPKPYADMDTVIRDTRPVMLWQDDATASECIWRTTRKFNMKLSKWEEQKFWAMVVSRDTPIAFDPVGWSRP